MEYSGAGGKLIHGKNQKQKISWHCPFNRKPFKFKFLCVLQFEKLWTCHVSSLGLDLSIFVKFCWKLYRDPVPLNAAIMTCTGPYFLFFCRGFKLVGPMVIMVYRMLAQVSTGYTREKLNKNSQQLVQFFSCFNTWGIFH